MLFRSGEPYQMPEHGQRKVFYAGRQELEQAIQNAFFLAAEKEGPIHSYQEGGAGVNGGGASRKAQDVQQGQPLATIPNFVKKQDGPPPDASGG